MEATGAVPAGTAAAVRAKAAGKLDRRAHPRARGAHAPRRDRVPDPRRGAGGRAGALAAPRHDVVRRARRVAGAARWSRRADRDPGRRRPAARGAAGARADEHRATPMIGRSHGIHAEPITAGLVFAGFYAELGRARARAGRRARRGSRSARSPARSAPTPTWTRRSRRRRWRRWACARRRCRRRSSRATATPSLLPGAGAAGHRRRAASRSPCATGSAPRWARRGGLRQGAEGLVRDAAQEEPDPVGEPVRPRAPAARRTPAPRSRTSRCGTSATSRTRRSSG